MEVSVDVNPKGGDHVLNSSEITVLRDRITYS